jgi:hypothetical protein
VNKSVHFLDLFELDILLRLKAVDLARDLRGDVLGIELRDAADARSAVDQAVPACFRIKSFFSKRRYLLQTLRERTMLRRRIMCALFHKPESMVLPLTKIKIVPDTEQKIRKAKKPARAHE